MYVRVLVCACECMCARPWESESLANAEAQSISEGSPPNSNKHTRESEKHGMTTTSRNPQ